MICHYSYHKILNNVPDLCWRWSNFHFNSTTYQPTIQPCQITVSTACFFWLSQSRIQWLLYFFFLFPVNYCKRVTISDWVNQKSLISCVFLGEGKKQHNPPVSQKAKLRDLVTRFLVSKQMNHLLRRQLKHYIFFKRTIYFKLKKDTDLTSLS